MAGSTFSWWILIKLYLGAIELNAMPNLSNSLDISSARLCKFNFRDCDDRILESILNNKFTQDMISWAR